MKTFLVIIQTIYLFSLFLWFFIWNLSFMVFDDGVTAGNTSFFAAITAYPLAVIVCSILAWILQSKKPITAFILSCIPMLWILAFVWMMLYLNPS